jgi:type I restriction enzyme S subunit
MSEVAKQDWRKTNLGALATKLVNGGTPPTDVPQFWQGRYPWITGADFTDSGIGPIRRFVSDDAISQTATNLINRGQLLIVTRTGVGKLAIAPTDIAISQDITGFYIDGEQATADFLYHRLKLGLEDLKKLNQGTSINGITRGDLVGYSLEIPPIRQQRRIATILTTLDEVIEATEKLVEKHQQIKAGLMHDLFTRGLWTREELARGDHKGIPAEASAKEGQLRPTPQEAPGLYQYSKVGLVPKEWAVKPLADYTQHDITYGIVQAGPHVEGGIPYIRTGDMSGEELVRDEMLCTTPLIAASYSRSQIRKGEIVCAIRATVGKVLPVPEDLDGANLTQGTARIAPNSQTHTGFLLWAIRCARVQREISLTIKGTTFMEITLGDLRKLPLAAPKSFDEQASIAAQLEGCESMIRKTRTHLAKLRQQKQGLMHDLLTGRVRVDNS